MLKTNIMAVAGQASRTGQVRDMGRKYPRLYARLAAGGSMTDIIESLLEMQERLGSQR